MADTQAIDIPRQRAKKAVYIQIDTFEDYQDGVEAKTSWSDNEKLIAWNDLQTKIDLCQTRLNALQTGSSFTAPTSEELLSLRQANLSVAAVVAAADSANVIITAATHVLEIYDPQV